jgi:hypothetical protein
VITDGSLGDYSRGAEFVSPILRGEQGLNEAREVMRAIADLGCTVSKKCGLHVHIGVGRPGLHFFKNLMKLYAAFEPVIDSIMPASRRANNNAYCRSQVQVNQLLISSATSFHTFRAAANPNGRYSKLNFHSYSEGGRETVEFRQHSGTTDGDKAVAWIALCQLMVERAFNDMSALQIAAPRINPITARPGSKSYQIGTMMLRPEGVTAREAANAVGWPSVSLPQQAGMCGLQFTTQRTGRVVRYFAAQNQPAPAAAADISIDGFATMIAADAATRAYLHRRATDLAGPVAWAA